LNLQAIGDASWFTMVARQIGGLLRVWIGIQGLMDGRWRTAISLSARRSTAIPWLAVRVHETFHEIHLEPIATKFD